MPKLDRYLLSEFAQSTFATIVVLLIVCVGGAFTDVLSDIARGRVPAGMMLAQLGLSVINYMPLILPLGLMLGLMLGFGRLYRPRQGVIGTHQILMRHPVVDGVCRQRMVFQEAQDQTPVNVSLCVHSC